MSPPQGTPCAFELPVLDMSRAKTFYNRIFNWTFEDGTVLPPDKFQLASLPDKSLAMQTALMKVADGASVAKGAATKAYFHVDDIEAAGAEIEKAGGKKPGKIIREGDVALFGNAEDTEGNVIAIYQVLGGGH